MQLYKNVFGMEFSHKSALMLAFLAVFPNVLGMIVLDTGLGFKFHLFQILIFLAAMMYGKWGGALSGAFGSVYTAIALGNPYIIIGNIMLGFFTGIFAKRAHIALAVLGAFAIQAPWLYYTDLLAGMPEPAVRGVIVALLFSNIAWAFVAGKAYKRLKKLIQ
ncbi:MAG: hypothetical protein JW744_02155 [Candidatus Diapherotrites archaeon]|uniref:Uncharacterized protein n=1 Tax=Candidatus Iainarchaeum sp. TaxID=3101447 RepID=A0A939C8S1_9ARCH|nr:hypothetical protein [Candidatus Diapherotrites archaeon]